MKSQIKEGYIPDSCGIVTEWANMYIVLDNHQLITAIREKSIPDLLSLVLGYEYQSMLPALFRKIMDIITLPGGRYDIHPGDLCVYFREYPYQNRFQLPRKGGSWWRGESINMEELVEEYDEFQKHTPPPPLGLNDQEEYCPQSNY